MARDQATVTCAAGSWTQLTNADVTSITFQVLDQPCYIRFTTDTTTPTEDEGIIYEAGAGELNKLMTDLTTLSGADRVWAKPANPKSSARVYVDHA